MIGTKEYYAWYNMRDRCRRKTHRYYKNYGGRGIKVCQRWDSFENFLSDMGRAPSPNHSLDRIDNNKGYSPDNCKWATIKEQMNNKTSTLSISCHGLTMSLRQWCEFFGLEYERTRYRLFKKKLPKDKVLVPNVNNEWYERTIQDLLFEKNASI